MSAAVPTDADLVDDTLSGNREAFARIVARYQSLICSLAYTATGSLGQSEDLAQETFITAWKHMGRLRERDKLRAWLCGIARNRINSFLRREGREPVREAEPLENHSESHAPEPLPRDYVISREEEAILWRSLEQIPGIYREPLVLFYREHRSVEAVAHALELSQDAVHQRLSRGRKMLQEQVLAFVEGALEKTSPGKNFTSNIIASLPLATASAKATAVGTAIAKGGAAAKGAMTIGTLGGFFAMLGGAYVSFMAQADDSKSPRERQFMFRMFGKRMCFTLLLLAGFIVVVRMNFFHAPLYLVYYSAAALGFLAAVYSSIMLPRYTRQRQQIQIEDNTFDPAEWTRSRKLVAAATDSTNKKLNGRKALRFMAFGLGALVFVVLQESWKRHPGHAVLVTAYMTVALLWGFLRWQNRPRFTSFRNFIFVFPMAMCLITLFFLDWQQYLAHLGGDTSRMIPLAEMLTFNLVVTLVYTALVGSLVWRRKTDIPQN